MDSLLYRLRFLVFILLSIAITFIFYDNLINSAVKTKALTKKYNTKKDLKSIKKFLIKYKTQNGLYPPDHRFIMWYKNNLSNQLKFKFPMDRWGEPLIYKTFKNREFFELISKGIDQKAGTADDIIIKPTIK